MIILEKPNFPPYVCITCGVGTGRKWFVQLDYPLDNYFNPVNEGQIFQCNECWEALATKVAKDVQVFMLGQEPWNEGEYVQPTYDNVTELKKEVSFGGTTSKHPAGHDIKAELSNPKPTGSDSEPDTTDNDDETDAVREFRVFFDGGDNGEPA